MASSGNFAVFNPLSKVGTITFSEGNTIAKHANNKENTRHGTTFNIPNTGKWYFECKFVNCVTNGSQSVMFTLHDVATEMIFSSKNFLTQAGNFISFYNWENRIYVSNSYTAYTSNIATQSNAIVSCAIDRDNSHMWVAVNNTWINGTPDFTDGTNKVASPSASLEYGLAWSGDGGGSSQFWTANFGQDSTFAGTETAQGNQDDNGFGDFYYSPPSGFLALSSANLPISDDIDPAQTDDDYVGGKQHNTIVYTGSGSGQSISGLGFKPDMVWIQNYSSQNQTPRITDSSRGVTKTLQPPYTSTEGTESGVTAFGTDGFTLGSATGGFNTSSASYVAWCWRANGGTTASNSDGSITTTVQVNQKAGFSIVTYTGNETSGATIGHGLGVVPKWIIVKNRDYARNWACYHVFDNNSGQKALLLNSNSTGDVSNYWGGNQPTSSVLTLGGETEVNKSGDKIVAYFWAEIEGFSKFGGWTANGSEDGPFIYTGFRPKLVVIKGVSATNNWMVFDTARSSFNPIDNHIKWNSDGGEVTEDYRDLDFLSNGFKIQSSNGALNHPSGDKYVYMAWGDVPFKYGNTF